MWLTLKLCEDDFLFRLMRPGCTRSIGRVPVGDAMTGVGRGAGMPRATPCASGGGGRVKGTPPNCRDPAGRGPMGAPRRALVPEAELASASEAAGPPAISLTGGRGAAGMAASGFSSTVVNLECRLFAPDIRKKCFWAWLATCVGVRDGT